MDKQEAEGVPYSFLEVGDYFQTRENGKVFKVLSVEGNLFRVQAKDEEPHEGKPQLDKEVLVLTVFNGKPLPAAKRAQERLNAILAPLGAEQICMATMTPGEVAMHLELFHGIHARNYASVPMEPRARGRSLRETHTADHAAISEHGVKPPAQVPHTHDDAAFRRGAEAWIRDSQQKTR